MNPKKRRRRLTLMQKKLLKATILEPDASLERRGLQSGYTCRQHVHRAMNSPAIQDALSKLRGLMEQRERLSLEALLIKLEEGLDATKVFFLKINGSKFRINSTVADHKVRRNFLKAALGLHGAI